MEKEIWLQLLKQMQNLVAWKQARCSAWQDPQKFSKSKHFKVNLASRVCKQALFFKNKGDTGELTFRIISYCTRHWLDWHELRTKNWQRISIQNILIQNWHGEYMWIQWILSLSWNSTLWRAASVAPSWAADHVMRAIHQSSNSAELPKRADVPLPGLPGTMKRTLHDWGMSACQERCDQFDRPSSPPHARDYRASKLRMLASLLPQQFQLFWTFNWVLQV